MLTIKLDITQSINFKGLYEYFFTPEKVIGIRERAYKHNCPVPLMYFVLYRMALKAQAADQAAGQYTCPECSYQAGHTVRHGNSAQLEEFKQKYRKALPYLQRIQDELI